MKKLIALALSMFLMSFAATGVYAYVFPSTNELNKNMLVPGREGQVAPYVEEVSSDIGEVTLRFVNESVSLAFFEYRIDGEVLTSGTAHPVTGDFIYPGVCVDGRPSPVCGDGTPVERTFNADEYVEVRLALGGERDWDFDWTRFDVLPNPDLDGDGVLNAVDYCPGTKSDATTGFFTDPWGVHRWYWDDGLNFSQQPNSKDKGLGGPFSINDTHGCSCKQILDIMQSESGDDLGGQYKYGCSTGILKTFVDSQVENTFTATDSFYYNGPTDAAPLYGSGEISFSWNKYTGVVTGGYYNEVVPAYIGTTYYNIVSSGSVVGNTVNLTFTRTIPNVYGPFTFTGTLVGSVLTGMLDGPYLFTATGI